MQAFNPYANPNGVPKTGYAEQFWDWEKNKEEKRLAAMTPKERKRAQAIKKHMAAKMQSPFD